jgi:hypothetical protein
LLFAFSRSTVLLFIIRCAAVKVVAQLLSKSLVTKSFNIIFLKNKNISFFYKHPIVEGKPI